MVKNFEFTEIGKLGKSISVQEMKGNDAVYLRLTKLYKTDEGEWKPTNKGVSVPLSECQNLMGMLSRFIETHGVNSPKAVDLSADVSVLE